jgi:uncharacterized protein YjdB
MQLISTSVSISQTSASIALGSSLQLSATALGHWSDGSTTSLSVLWETACPAIATTDQTGLVQATSGTGSEPYYVQGGTVNISAYAMRPDGSPCGAPAVCTVTVNGSGTRPFLTAVNEAAQWENSL